MSTVETLEDHVVPSLAFEEVSVGDTLPELLVDVSRRNVIATAIATRDYQDVHHDHEAARARGSQDIFMNILTSNGFVLRFVTDWAGPQAIVEHASIRLGVPNYAGDEMRMTGEVVGREEREDEGAVEVAVVGRNALGEHVTGTVRISLPRKGHA